MAVSRSTVTSKKTPAKVPAIKAQASQAAPTPKHAAAITTKRKTAAAAPSTSTDKGKKRARQEIEEDTVALPSDSQEDDSDDDFSAIEDLESASEVDSDDDEDEADSSDEEEEEQQDEKYKAGGKAKKVSFDTKQLPEVNKQAKKGERQQQKKSVRALCLTSLGQVHLLRPILGGTEGDGRHLPRTHPAWLPRGRDALLLLSVWRRHAPASLSQQEGAPRPVMSLHSKLTV